MKRVIRCTRLIQTNTSKQQLNRKAKADRHRFQYHFRGIREVSFNIDKNDLALVFAQLWNITEAPHFEVMMRDKKTNFSYKQQAFRYIQ
jgi:hypothetical protein